MKSRCNDSPDGSLACAFAPDAGFTLVELLAAITVLSFVVMTATPLLRNTPAPVQIAADATRLAAALRVTRAAAMARGQDMALIISPSARSYGSPSVPTVALDPRIVVSTIVAQRERSSSGDGIRFFPNGRSTGGEVSLRLQLAEVRVRVNWATGRVNIIR